MLSSVRQSHRAMIQQKLIAAIMPSVFVAVAPDLVLDETFHRFFILERLFLHMAVVHNGLSKLRKVASQLMLRDRC